MELEKMSERVMHYVYRPFVEENIKKTEKVKREEKIGAVEQTAESSKERGINKNYKEKNFWEIYRDFYTKE